MENKFNKEKYIVFCNMGAYPWAFSPLFTMQIHKVSMPSIVIFPTDIGALVLLFSMGVPFLLFKVWAQ